MYSNRADRGTRRAPPQPGAQSTDRLDGGVDSGHNPQASGTDAASGQGSIATSSRSDVAENRRGSSMTDIEIRLATPDDEEVIATHNAAMAVETEGRELDRDVLRSGVRRVLSDSTRGVYYLAERDGTIVGQLLITLEWSDWRDGWFWWIQSVYVAPAARRQGVYSALYKQVEAEARRRSDVCGIRLYVEQENTRAQRVYERLGMQRAVYQLYEIDWGKRP
jgi:ribosomal protein S18 acetylase RimI-like enzyme